jgi:hypothetical protein
MADSMDPAVINAVTRRIVDALADTTAHSTLSEDEQDARLAQACAEACDVLSAWRASSSWKALEPAGHARKAALRDAVADWDQLRPFLDPVRETLRRIADRRAGDPGGANVPAAEAPEDYIDKLIKSAKFTVFQYPGLDREQLYQDADRRLDDLQGQVCATASDFREGAASDAQRRARRRRAISLLRTVGGVLLSISLTMAGASPAAVRADIPAWGHEAVQVLLVHQVAHSAAPTVSIAPPKLGPRIGG